MGVYDKEEKQSGGGSFSQLANAIAGGRSQQSGGGSFSQLANAMAGGRSQQSGGGSSWGGSGSQQGAGQTVTMPQQSITLNTLGQIYQLNSKNREAGQQFFNEFRTMQLTPGNEYSNPYVGPTNSAVYSLQQNYGIDTSKLNDEWFSQNPEWQSYLIYNGTTTTPSKPGKRASQDQKLAYDLYQWQHSEETTRQAEQEWAALQKELTYWANQKDRNYSDDEILGRINWDKYKTLQKMDEGLRDGAPLELNRPVMYSQDAMRGVLWAARNDGGTGDIYADMANYALGSGNQWQSNAGLSAKLDPTSADFNPYAVGSTMDKEREFFGVPFFDEQWLKSNKWMLSSGTEEQKKNYISVAEAFDVTQAAKSELTDLKGRLDKKLAGAKNPEAAKKWLSNQLDSGDYNTLLKMDKTRSKGYGILSFTEAVDYRKEDLEKYIDDWFAAKTGTDSGIDYVEEVDQMANTPEAPADATAPETEEPDTIGQYGQGNIDLYNRPIYTQEDGSVSTVNSISFQDDDGKEVLIPTIVNGQQVSDDEAIEHYRQTGEYLGKFDTPEEANEYAERLHEQQERIYNQEGPVAEPSSVQGTPAPELTPTPVPAPEQTPAPEQPAAQPTRPPLTEQEKEIYAQQDQELADAIDMAEGAFTPAESLYMDSAGSVTTDYMTESLGGVKAGGTEAAKNVAKAEEPKIIQGHVDATLGNMQVITDYEQNEANLDALRFREQELAAQIAGKEYVGLEVDKNPEKTIEKDGRTYRVGLALSEDGYYVDYIDDITGGTEFGIMDRAEWDELVSSDEISSVVKAATEEAAKTEEQNRNAVPLTEEEEEVRKQLQAVRLQIEDGEAYQRENEATYREADAAFKADQEAVRRTLLHNQELGLDTTEIEKAEMVVAYLTQFSKYEATQWSKYNPTDMYAQALAAGEDRETVLGAAKQGNDEIGEALETAKSVKQYIADKGLKVPDSYLYNLDRHIAKLERDQKAYDYFALSQRDDFEEMARKGREIEYENRPQWVKLFGLIPNDLNNWSMDQYYAYQENGEIELGGQYDSYGLKAKTAGLNGYMSPLELDTYYAMIGSGDEQGAKDYINFMIDPAYGVLHTRKREAVEKKAQGIVDSGLGGFLGGNALAVLMSPVSSISAMGGYAYNLFTGSELNPDSPFLTFSHFRNATREESAAEIAEHYKKTPWKQKLAQAGYEIVTNRLDSAANAVAFGGLFGEAAEGASFGVKAVKETLSALPMGISASMDAAAEAKSKGASDAQAYFIAGITALAETVTEGVSLENMQEAFKAGADPKTIKQWLLNWVKKAGPSEAFGESLNDAIEGFSDEKIMGALSDHADRVWAYRMQRMSPEEAEAAARKDELNGILRTAIISFASPGLDIVRFGAGRLNYYQQVTRAHQEAGDNRSMLEIMRDKPKPSKTTTETVKPSAPEAKAPTTEAPVAEAPTAEAPVAAVKPAEAPAASPEAEAAAINHNILYTAQDKSAPAQTAAVAAVLSEGNGETTDEFSSAAAVRLNGIFGDSTNTLTAVDELMTGASVAKVQPISVQQALKNAALSQNSQAYQTMQSEEYKAATPDVKAQMLVGTIESDMYNQAVLSDITQAIREHRISAETKRMLAAGAMRDVQPTVDAANEASRNARVAESMLEDRQEETRAAQDAVAAAGEEVQRDPAAGAVTMTKALDKLNSASAVEQEYQQKAETSQRKEREARDKAGKAVDAKMTEIRQQATETVNERKANEAIAAEEARKAEEAQALVDAERQVQQDASDNAFEADIEGFINENYPDATEEEKQQIRNRFEAIREIDAAQKSGQLVTPDQADAEAKQNRGKFLKQISDKFGVQIEEADETPFSANGYVDEETGKIVLNKNATVDDAVYFVMGHELTHVAEQSGTYSKLADSILGLAFGEGSTYRGVLAELESGNASSPLAQAVLRTKQTYDNTLGKNHSYESILQEVVADNMGYLLRGDPNNPQAQQDLINRLVAEEPSTARRILDSIKSFLKKMVGAKGAWVSDAQHTVDLFEKALKDAQSKREQTVTEAKPLTDRQGNETAAEEFRGGTVAIDTTRFSLNSFNESERERTRKALLAAENEDGTKRFTQEQVDQYLDNAMGLAAEIAKDRTRLDFEASDNPLMTFLKKNQDYGFTLDASTLCAKRLLYQGTFNYVQHALPDEVFTPEDLVDLVNIMNEMGYETPCGICYVESRRRWLDTYANEFVDRITEDPGAFVDKVFEKAKAEEKAELLERLSDDNKPSIEDLTTTDGLEKLRKSDPLMYKAFVAAMNAKGSANPKIVQPRTEYKGEISKLTKKQIQNLKDIGGLRVQSFSDFETPHLLDMVQAVMDMSAVGLTSQAYTKVPNFAWVFGDTGIKINLSLIGKGTGLDDNGNLIFDNKEGINFDEAMKLRDRYSKNVGTILVGINDDHIVAAMADPRIDFIIPFHKSGWSDVERKGIKTLQYYEDYTATQNERKLFKDENGNYVKEKDGSYKTVPAKKSKLVNFEPVGAHKYWEFDKSGEWNARKYLKMCAEDGRIPKFNQFLVDNGDGTFSLPEGDDKRSKAIREGYWKTLIDFKMYDNDGVGADQTAVTPNINMDQAYRVMSEYSLSRPSGNPDTKMVDMKNNNDVPVATTAADKFIQMIKDKRAGKNPDTPLDSMQADPDAIPVDANRPSLLHDQEGAAPVMGTAAAAAMAQGANPELSNFESTAQDTYDQGQQRMAVDPETGETVSRKYSLPEGDSEAERLRDQYRTAQQTEIDLRDRKKQIDNSDEMKSWENRMMAARGDDLKALLAEYKQWETETGYADIAKAYEEAKKATKDASKAYDTYVEQKNIQDEQEKIAASGLSEPDWRRKEAVKEFGYTTNVNEAGYMLPNGKMLNFTGEKGKHYGYRGQDHRAIGTIYASQEKQFTAAMNAFMNDGNIRLMPESPGIDISNAVEPTPEQYSGIRSMIRALANKEYFSVDFSDQSGHNIGSLEYEGRVRPDRVVNDIKSFFQTGEVPQQNNLDRFRYSLPSDAPYMAAVERGEMDQAQQMVDEKAKETGYSDKAYHGTDRFGFTEFNTDNIFVSYGQELAGTYAANSEVRASSGANDKISRALQAMREEGGDVTDLRFNPETGMYEYTEYTAYGPYTGELTEQDIDNYAGRDQSGVYQLYTRPGRQLVIDGNGANWNEIEAPMVSDQPVSTNDIADWAKDNGYNSVRINDIYDSGENSAGREHGDIGIFFNPNDVKSADPVTYDNQGNPIPLSERFNQESNDIRYSLPSDMVLDQQIRQYLAQGGRLSTQTRRTNNLPGAVQEPGGRQRQFGSQTAQESNALHQEVKDYLYNHSTYTPESNREQIDRAVNWVRSYASESDPDGYRAALGEVTSDSFDYRSADGQARMLTVMSMAALKADQGDASALNDELQLADAYNKQGTDLGRSLQARKIFRMMTPVGRISYFQKQVDNLNKDIGQKTGKTGTIKLSEELIDQIGKASSEEDFAKARKAAAKQIGEQIPANWKDKLRSWRMLAMLGNPRTHIRNIIGNAMFIPAVSLKNKMGAVAELGLPREAKRPVLKPGEVFANDGKNHVSFKFDGYNGYEATGNQEVKMIRFSSLPNIDVAGMLGEDGWEKRGSTFIPPRTRHFTANEAAELIQHGNEVFMAENGIRPTEIIPTRTKTLSPFLSKEIRDFARQDAVTMRDTLTGEAKYNETDLIERERRQFKGVFQALSDFNSNALEGEDWFFLKGHYRRALGGWMQANGYTAEQMQSNPELLEIGRAYAIKEAKKATYRDFNGLAKKLNDLVRNPETTGQKALAFGVEAVLPFKKTPANILKRGIEYSPVGIARSIVDAATGLRQYNAFQRGELDVLPKSAKSPNEVIDEFCSGLTGTAIMAMGAIFGSMGAVSTGLNGDDDDDEFEKLKGNQPYAIKFNLFGQDVTFTMDWAAPMSMPFFVGAAIQNQAQRENGYDIDSLINAFGNITEPVFNLSMLDGVNSLIDMFVAGDDTNATLTQLGAKVTSNYVSSYIPSVLGAATRTFFDDTRRKAFVESGQGSGIMGTFRYAREQVENKIPGLSKTNIPYRDVWGNAETSSFPERLLENFVLPGYVNQYKDDPVVNELSRIGAPPKEPAKTFTVDKEKYILTAEQWDTYKTVRGQTAYSMLQDLIQQPSYQDATDDEKRSQVSDVWDYANKAGQAAAVPTANVNWSGVHSKQMLTALDSGDYEGFETMVEALREDGVEDDKIRTKIRDTYRDKYKEAYRNEDYETMEAIYEKMATAGFDDLDKKNNIISQWEKAVDKEQDEDE